MAFGSGGGKGGFLGLKIQVGGDTEGELATNPKAKRKKMKQTLI